MTKVICAAVDCKFNSSDHRCKKKEITLTDNYVQTVYDGRQHFNRCRDYEYLPLDEFLKNIRKKEEPLMPNPLETIKTNISGTPIV